MEQMDNDNDHEENYYIYANAMIFQSLQLLEILLI